MLSVLAEFNLDEVLPFVGKRGTPKKEYTIENKTFNLRMTSLRLRTFKRSPTCVICGLVGCTILLEEFEIHGGEETVQGSGPHFNLYGEGTPSDVFMSHPRAVDGSLKSKLVLLTKDHIVPKSKGGHDGILNMQTMCVICNGLKKNASLTNKMLKALRLVYDENLSLPRNELIQLLNQNRTGIKKRPKRKAARKRKKKRDQDRGNDPWKYHNGQRTIS